MDVYYRGRCRAVAVIDIIWSSVGLGSAVLTFFGIALISQGQSAGNEGPFFRNTRIEYKDEESNLQLIRNKNGQEVHVLANVMLGMVMLVILINTVQLMAAIRLLKACNLATDNAKALKFCRFWSGVTVFFVVFIGLNLFSTGRISFPGQIFSMAQIMFRALGLYYVSEFIKELAHPMPILPIVGDTFVEQPPPSVRNFFPKPTPPPPYPTEEVPPPPYQEAPPPYTEVHVTTGTNVAPVVAEGGQAHAQSTENKQL